MHSKITSLAVDCCCVRITTNKEGDCLKLFEGGELNNTVTHFPAETVEAPLSTKTRKLGLIAFATWRAKWLLAVLPHGRASLFELNRGKLSLNSTFDCPANTAAALMLDDDVDDCALVVFGTDEARSSRVHVARLTFSSESLAIKPLKIWRCPGGVSSLAYLSNHMLLVGYTSCEGVGTFDPFSFEDITSPSLAGGRARPIKPSGLDKSGIEKEDFIHTAIRTDGLAVWVITKGKKVITLTQCGILQCFEIDLQQADTTLQLGFDCVGIRTMSTVECVVVAGWRGEIALVDIDSGQVARFIRTRDTARVDDFAVTISSDSRILLLFAEANESSSLSVCDLGRAALMGSAAITPLNSPPLESEDDLLVFVGDDGSEKQADDTLDVSQMKSLLKDSFVQMIEESE
jgi:hypothetical protein